MSLIGGATLSAFFLVGASTAVAFDKNDVAQLIETKSCFSCDLSGADLSGLFLAGADLSSANLSAANLTGADLSGAKLQNANLQNSNLTKANLSRAILKFTNLNGANLTSATVEEALFMTPHFDVNLTGVELGSARLCNIPKSDGSLDRSGC